MIRGVARKLLEEGSKSSKMSATMDGQQRKFGLRMAETVNVGPFSMRFHLL